MAYKKRRGKRWQIGWYEHNDLSKLVEVRRTLAPGTTEKQAEAARVHVEHLKGSGQRVLALPGLVTLAELLDGFLKDKRAKREAATARGYAKHIGHFRRLLPCFRKVGDVSAGMIDAYLAERLNGYEAEVPDPQHGGAPRLVKFPGVAKVTANKERATLSAIFNWGIRKNLCTKNPAFDVDPFSVREEPPAACPDDVYHSLCAGLRAAADETISHGPRDDKPRARMTLLLMLDLVRLIWHTGLRMGEACLLRPKDIDQSAWVATVRSAANKGPGVMPVPPGEAREILERRIDLGHEFVFASSRWGGARGAFYHRWEKWIAKHPEHAAAHPHALRHAFQKRLEKAGTDEGVIKRLMRHKTWKMHEHYSHREIAQLMAAVEAVTPSDAPESTPGSA